jgi:hypothetical protein
VQYTSGKQKAPKGTRSEKGNIDRRMGYTSEPVYRCDEDSDDYAANYGMLRSVARADRLTNSFHNLRAEQCYAYTMAYAETGPCHITLTLCRVAVDRLSYQVD